jgi:hypothetical protein
MAATLSTVDAILQDDYKDYIEQLNNATFILAQVSTSKDTVDGRRATHSIHIGRSGGIGAGGEGVALPTADQQRHAVVQIPVRTNRARIQLSQQLMSQANGSPGSFVDALENEMSGIKNDSMRDINRQVWGTSNGVIATCGSSGPSTTVQLATTTPANVFYHLYPGRRVSIGTVANPSSIVASSLIASVDATNKTITIADSVTVTAAAFVFNVNAGGASDNTGAVNDGQQEMTGLQTIVDNSATLHTLAVASAPAAWKSQVYSNSGTNRAFTEALLDWALIQNIAESGESVDALVSGVGVFLSAKNVLTAYQRNVDTVEFKGGFKGIKWSTPGVSGIQGGEVGWFADFDAPPNRIYGLNTRNGLVVHQVEEGWQWWNPDGAILSRVADQLSAEATAYTMQELACRRRNAHFVIKDLTEVSF